MTSDQISYVTNLLSEKTHLCKKCKFDTKEECYRLLSLALACGFTPVTQHEVDDEALTVSGLNRDHLLEKGYITTILNEFVMITYPETGQEEEGYTMLTKDEFKAYCARKGRN